MSTTPTTTTHHTKLLMYGFECDSKFKTDICPLFEWASLIAQLVKNPPAMQETPVRFPGQEDLLEKG